MFTNAKEVMINGKIVKKITDEEEKMILYLNGGITVDDTLIYITNSNSVGLYKGFTFKEGVEQIVDWGDGTTTDVTSFSSQDIIAHSYSDGESEHTIQIKGINGLVKKSTYLSWCNTLIIPKSVTTIPDSCFGSNTSNPSTLILKGVKTIETYAFKDWFALTNVILEDGVESIGSRVFDGCKFTEITLPNTVISLGGGWHPSTLKQINLNWITPPMTFSESHISTSSGGLNPPLPPVPGESSTTTTSTFKITIPNGTTQNYIDKGFPSDNLVER